MTHDDSGTDFPNCQPPYGAAVSGGRIRAAPVGTFAAFIVLPLFPALREVDHRPQADKRIVILKEVP
jgi:hypothetical protein